jgi:hypothetical protein
MIKAYKYYCQSANKYASCCAQTLCRRLSSRETQEETRVDIENIRLIRSDKAPGKGLSSLVESSLLAMEADKDFKITSDMIRRLGRQHMTAEEQKRQRRGTY